MNGECKNNCVLSVPVMAGLLLKFRGNVSDLPYMEILHLGEYTKVNIHVFPAHTYKCTSCSLKCAEAPKLPIRAKNGSQL